MSPFSIVIIIVIIVLLVIIWKYVLSDPNTLQGIQSGQTASTISASTLATNGSNVPSSNFAYSVWFYINDWNYRYGEPKVVFGRMGAKSTTGNGSVEGVSGLDPCPAVTLGAIENNIFVISIVATAFIFVAMKDCFEFGLYFVIHFYETVFRIQE